MSSLVFRITGDPSSFKAAMADVTSSLDKANTRAMAFGETMTSVGSKLSTNLSLPLIAMGGYALKASADLDSLQRALLSTTGSAAEAAKQFKRLEDVAKLPGIGLEEAVRGSIRLQNYGFSAALAERALRTFSNAVAGAGGSAEDTGEALRQLGQIMGRGAVTMDNLRIILERVPQAAKIIKQTFGPDALGDPAKYFKDAGINAEKFINILITQMEKINPTTGGLKTEFENLSQSIQKTAAAWGDVLAPAMRAVIKDGLEPMLLKVQDLSKAFALTSDSTKALTIGMVALAAAVPIAIVVLGTIVTNLSAVVGAATTVSTALAAALTAIQTYGIATSAAIGIMAGAWVAAAAVGVYSIGSLVSAFINLYDAMQKVETADNSLAFSIEKLLSRVKVAHPEIGALELRYRAGQMSAADFSVELRKVASTMESTTVPAKKASDAATTFGGAVAGATNKIHVAFVAFGPDGEISKNSLFFVELQERIKAAVSKSKDAVFELLTAGEAWGKKLETWKAPIQAYTLEFTIMSAAIQTATENLKLLSSLPPPQVEINKAGLEAQSRTGIVGLNNAASTLGFETDQARYVRLQNLARALDEVRAAYDRGQASGTDLAKAQEAYNKAADEGTKKTHAQSAAMKQVSTIMTDLSRGIANAAVGLFFDKTAKADLTQFKDELASLKEQEDKLIASQQKGNNVTKELAAVHQKMADVSAKMGDAIQKSSFGFRALQAGKAVVEDLAKSITRVLIEGALEKLTKKLISVSGVMEKVFGGGADGASPIFSNSASSGSGGISGMLGGGSSSDGGSSSGGALSAASGAIGIANLVTGAVTAVSSVISNFQFAHMNTALGRIEESTRYVKIWTGEQSQSILWSVQTTAARLLYATATLDSIARFDSEILGNIQQMNQRGMGAAGGGAVINMAGAYLLSDVAFDDFIERIARRLKQQGL